MPQFLALPEEIDEINKTALLRGEEARHLSLASRGKSGEVVEIFDGRGRKFRGKAARFTKDSVLIEALAPLSPVEPNTKVTVAQALIKGERWEWFLEKAVELGAGEIIPLVTERTISRPASGDAQKKLERWEKLVLSATKQCERGSIPRINAPLPLEKWLSGLGPCDGQRLVCAERSSSPNPRIDPLKPVIVAVGPEGGWSDTELGALERKGFLSFSLGKIILRSETAALKALSLLCG